jgi:hypothetical protein
MTVVLLTCAANPPCLNAENQARVEKNAVLTARLQHIMEQGQVIGNILPNHQQEAILNFAEMLIEKEHLEKLIRELQESAARAEEKKFRNHLIAGTGALAVGVLYSLYNNRRSLPIPPIAGVSNPGVVNIINVGVNKINVGCLSDSTIGKEPIESSTLFGMFRSSKYIYKIIREHVDNG